MNNENQKYTKTLLQYFEEEISGEAYFYGLAKYFDEPHQKGKLDLLARVERCAAEAVRPLLEKYDLRPRSENELAEKGRLWLESSVKLGWDGFVLDMSVRYIGYVDDFKALEAMAPPVDLPALEILTEHEVAAIKFAKLEIAGTVASAEPLREYLQSSGA